MDSYIQSFMELSPEDKRCCVGAIVFQVILISFILFLFSGVLFPSGPFSEKKETRVRFCVLCECRCNKDNKCETHMCQKIHDALRVYAEQKFNIAEKCSNMWNLKYPYSNEGNTWNKYDFFNDIVKNGPHEIRSKITKYLEEKIETKITVSSVEKMLGGDWPKLPRY